MPHRDLTSLYALEGFAKSHFSKHIEGKHLVPQSHVQAFAMTSQLPNLVQKLVHTPLNYGFLLHDCSWRESRIQRSPHLCIFLGVPLTSNAFTIEAAPENIVKIALDKGLCCSGTIYAFPGCG